MPLLTVFTPAYNRAHTIGRTYESLLKQSNKDFIWLIVDDGSSDNTQELVKEWMSKHNGFEIRYIHKENGGMHTAHNVAYEHIDTLLNICIDSDDCLAEDGINKILNKWEEVKDLGYAGIIGLDADLDGNIIGKGFPEGLKETTLSGYYANGGAGDKKLVYRTDIINKYPPYPVFEGEKYVSTAYKYRLIDQEYKLAVLDDVLCNVEYQADGSTATMWKQYVKNPRGFAFWRKVCMIYPESKMRLVIDTIHYCAESQLAGEKHYVRKSPKKLLTLVCVIPGLLLKSICIRKVELMDKQFSDDYYRMTGTFYKKGIKTCISMLFRHNLKYMYLWRNKNKNIITKFRIYRLCRKYGIEISSDAEIGNGLYMGHPYNITIASGVRMGKNCNVHKGVTIGRINVGKKEGVPTIGESVFFGINSIVVGNIHIGNDVLIAPNSYVNFDVPDHSIVIGNPGVIHHKENATEGYVNFKV